MRILHLIDQPAAARGAERPTDPDAALLLCRTVVQRLPEFEHSVCLIGGSALEERAAGVGLPATDRVAPPLGLTVKAKRGLAAYLRDRGEPDVVHCWSGTTVPLAAAATRAPLCMTPRGAWAGVDLRVSPAVRAASRAALGVEDERPVVLLIGGEPGEADALRLVFLLGLLCVADYEGVWLMPASSARIARALRFHYGSGWRSRLVVTGRSFAEQVAGADVGVWLGAAWADSVGLGPSDESAVLIGAAMGAGVPVVAPRSPAIAGLYSEAAAGECAAFNATVAEVARKLGPLVGDRARLAALRGITSGPHASGPSFEQLVGGRYRACRAQGAAVYAERP